MPTGTSPVVTGMFRLPDGTVSVITTVEQVRADAANADAIFWVNLDVSRAEEASLLKDVFQCNPLAIEDALNPASRVKLDEYPTFLQTLLYAYDADCADERELFRRPSILVLLLLTPRDIALR